MQPVRPVPKISAKKSSTFFLRVGELLVKEGFVQPADLVRALEIQKKGSEEAQMPIGTLMVQKNLISAEQLDTLLNHPDLRKTWAPCCWKKK